MTDQTDTLPPHDPLHGVKVVDLTTFLSGPFATQLLADMGADVIKVESPGGDSSRHIPPHFIDGDSAYYLANNRNKRSIAIDLKHPVGLETVKRLIQDADMVVENFRPGVCAKLGLDATDLMAKNPCLLWASISGFGQTGPWQDRPAYDMIVQALSGVMSLTGEPDRPAVRLGIPAGDVIAGMYAVIGLLAALADVRAGARGRIIDISMLDAQLTMLSYQAVYSLVSNTTPQPQGARHDSIPTYRSFVGSDGRELVVTANTERMWCGLCETLSLEPLVYDERFTTAALRLKNKDDLWGILEARFSDSPADYWVERLVDHQVPAALIRNVSEALLDARMSGRNMIIPVEDAERGKFEAIASPIKFSDAATREPVFPPRLGQHTDEVLHGLGVTETEIAEMRMNGTIS